MRQRSYCDLPSYRDGSMYYMSTNACIFTSALLTPFGQVDDDSCALGVQLAELEVITTGSARRKTSEQMHK